MRRADLPNSNRVTEGPATVRSSPATLSNLSAYRLRNDRSNRIGAGACGSVFVSLFHSPGKQSLCDIPLPVQRLLALLRSFDVLGQSLKEGFGAHTLPPGRMVVSVVAQIPEVVRQPALTISHCRTLLQDTWRSLECENVDGSADMRRYDAPTHRRMSGR
jgi:hypothetical protein